MFLHLAKNFKTAFLFLCTWTCVGFVYAQQDSTKTTLDSNVVISKSGREPAYRWKDHYLNRFSDKLLQSPLILTDPKNVKTDFSLNPSNKNVSVTERIGPGINYKLPQSMNFNEYSSIQNRIVRQNLLREYEQAQDGNGATRGKGLKPLLEKNPVVDRIFGGNIQDIKPNGFVTVDLGVRHQVTDNPQIPLTLRNQTFPFFDLNPNINFNGKIGEKMGLMGNFDAKAAFNFENQMRLNFKNQPEDILQKVEAGNVSMPINSQLIPGVQNLMGFKAGLKLGKLDATFVVAQQRSRTQSIVLNGGGQNKPYEIRCDNYEENRHFFLSHFFRENYERSLSQLPVITSNVRITRIEVYITNRTNNVETMRNLVALRELGEIDKEYKNIDKIKTTPTGNKVNPIYANILTDATRFRKDSSASKYLNSKGLIKGVEYEFLRGARRLSEREYRYQPELGYISLVTPLRNDEVLGVAYEYIYRGQTYKVGEMTEDYGAFAENDVIVLKLLKSATVRNRTQTDPLWKLMMKNVYSLGSSSLTRQGFSLRIVYKDDKTGVDNPFFQDAIAVPELEARANTKRVGKDIPLLEFFGLDRLNPNNDPVKDGNFDFVEDVTVDSRLGKIIIPRLEPFGSNLRKELKNEAPAIQNKYIFDELYTKTLADAQQVTTKNKFFIRGSSTAGGGAEVQLPLGAGQGVRVYAGGQTLQEGTDYILDPQSGRVRITNQSVLNSSRQIRVDYELPDLFQTQNRGLFGLRLDYNVSPSLHVGFTGMKMRESPAGFLSRTAIGNEPVNNNIIGTDINFKKESRFLTRLLDRLPLIQTKEISAVQFTGEYAKLFPSINNRRISNNSAMIDDFEAARNINDLTRGANRWRLGSTPQFGAFPYTANGRKTNYDYHSNRAKMSVYTADPSIYLDGGFGGGNVGIPQDLLDDIDRNIYEKPFVIQDIFAGRSQPVAGTQLPIASLDIAYFPEERGMYNYNTTVDRRGKFTEPAKNFGSIMRGITADNDFENANTEYLTFWMLNPFKQVVRDGKDESKYRINTGGRFFIHLGDISEDIIPDTYNNFENGILPPSYTNSIPYNTEWGKAPKVQYMLDAFDNQPESRALQDIGLDGLSDKEEREFKNIKTYLDNIRTKVDADVFTQIQEDPSSDNFRFFLDEGYNTRSEKLITRFKDYLGMERNSPVIDNSQQLTPSTTILPDKEDINADNTINDTEGYHEYEIDLRGGNTSMQVGRNNIIDKVVSGDGNSEWYLFRIPVRKPTNSYNINGFKSIRFMRVVMTDFKEPVVMRFAAMQFESNSYRLYDRDLNNPQVFVDSVANNATKIKVGVVNVEENGCDLASGNCNIKDGNIPYLVPPDFQRDRDVTQQNFFQFNEQSLSLNIEKLRAGDGRAVFKNTRLDLLFYKNLRLFIHAHHNDTKITRDSTAGAFIRLGTDLTENYYEIELPKLAVTPFRGSSSSYTEKDIWRNVIDFPLDLLRKLKSQRNFGSKPDSTLNVLDYGVGGDAPRLRNYRIKVVGNPDLSTILTVMLGVKNPVGGLEENLTVWMNELRASDFDQTSGDAAIMSADIKLADLATVSLNGSFKNYGFGGVQDKISERARDNSLGFGVAANIKVDKLFPESWGLQIPLFVNYDNQTIKPHFNPLDPDMPLAGGLNSLNSRTAGFSDLVNDVSERRGFNFSNVRKTKTGQGKSHFYDIENFSFTYAKNLITRTNILTKDYTQRQIRGGITYQFQPQAGKSWEPFKNSKSLDRPLLYWLKDFNLSPIPTVVAFRANFDRNYMKTHLRNADDNGRIRTDEADTLTKFYERYFWFNRGADLQWNLSKSLLISYSSDNHAIIDEPYGEYRKGSLVGDLFDFNRHRVKNLDQRLNTTYRLPLDKFFILDWMQADAKYNTNYNFQASAYNTIEQLPFQDENGSFFGNLAKNGREYGLQGRVDLVKLYNKFKFLRAANAPKVPKKRFTRNPGDDEEIEIPKSDVTKTFTRVLMAVRGINVDFTMIESTILPGYLSTPMFLGTNGSNPGYGFSVFGRQFAKDPFGFLQSINNRPVTINKSKGVESNNSLTNSLFLNDPFTQTRQKRFSYSTNLEPFKDFRIQIRGQLTRGDAFSYFYRDSTGKQLGRFSAVQTGNFSMSFWGINRRNIGAMTKGIQTDSGSNYRYALYENLVAFREIVRKNLNGKITEGQYNLNSQDVLIPAFFAAYAGKDPDKVTNKLWELQNGRKDGKSSKSPFFLPLPNWRIDFGGLANLKPFSRWFSSMTLNHAYSSTFNVGNFTSSLTYGDFGDQYLGLAMRGYKFGTQYDRTNPNNVLLEPVFVMNTITLEQKFQPLVGLNFVTKSKFTGKLEYNMERRAGLNPANAQVAEYNSDDFVFGFGFKKNNVRLPLRGRDGKNIVLKNDINVRIDWSIQNIKGLQRRLDGDPQPTLGGRNVQLRPNIQYMVNKRIMMNLYFTRTINDPFTSIGFYQLNSTGGVNLRFSLSE